MRGAATGANARARARKAADAADRTSVDLDDVSPVTMAHEMLHAGVDDIQIVAGIRTLFGLSRIDAEAAVAAAHMLNRHPRDQTGQPELLGPCADGLRDSGTLSRS